MYFYSDLTIFYQTSPYLGEYLTSFVGVLAQNTLMCGCRPVIYYSKVNTRVL